MKRKILIYILFIVYVGGLFLTNMRRDDLEIEKQQVNDQTFDENFKNQVELTFAFSNNGKEEKE